MGNHIQVTATSRIGTVAFLRKAPHPDGPWDTVGAPITGTGMDLSFWDFNALPVDQAFYNILTIQ